MERLALHPVRRHLVVVVAALGLVAAACGDDTDDGAGDGPTGSTQLTTTTVSTTTEDGEMDDDDTTDGTAPRTGQSDAAVADLAERLDIDPAEVTVVSVEAVTWSDGALGCPEPGMMYTQALVEGVRIVLEADGRRFRYHGGATGDPFLCADPQEPSSVG